MSRTGYDLVTIGSGRSEAAAVPASLWDHRQALRGAMEEAGAGLRRVVRKMLGLRGSDEAASMRLAHGTVRVFGRSRWTIERQGGRRSEGKGMLHLTSELYGVSPGVAAVRYLEAMSAETLDAEAALAVQRAIDDWSGRGAPPREA